MVVNSYHLVLSLQVQDLIRLVHLEARVRIVLLQVGRLLGEEEEEEEVRSVGNRIMMNYLLLATQICLVELFLVNFFLKIIAFGKKRLESFRE